MMMMMMIVAFIYFCFFLLVDIFHALFSKTRASISSEPSPKLITHYYYYYFSLPLLSALFLALPLWRHTTGGLGGYVSAKFSARRRWVF